MRKLLLLFVLLSLYSCVDDTLSTSKELTSFSFLKVNNSELTTDLFLSIDGNNVTGNIPYGIDITSLIASYDFSGKKISVNGDNQISGVSVIDFTEIIDYKITSEDGNSSIYAVDLTYFTGLPILSIATDGAEEILSKETYIYGAVDFYGGRNYESFTEPMKIRGRGNTTWNYFPKKPYQLKFDSKTSIMGIPKDKKWILLANYSDKTMIRNKIAFDMGEMSILDWTPNSQFIELFINDSYRGTYQISQKVEETQNRVNITNDGYLLEVDQLERLDEDDIYFETDRLLFNIKEPNLDWGDTEFTYINTYINEVESVLYGSDFTDPTNGYAKYLDVDTFVDWYLINEITKNNDAIFYSSVYMNVIPGEKIKMGPLWDFDIAMGNINFNGNDSPEGFWIKNASWIARLFEDPDFVEKVKVRFAFFKTNKETIFSNIELHATSLQLAQQENDLKWQTLGEYVWPNNMVFESYQQEVDYLTSWLEQRFNWLETAYADL